MSSLHFCFVCRHSAIVQQDCLDADVVQQHVVPLDSSLLFESNKSTRVLKSDWRCRIFEKLDGLLSPCTVAVRKHYVKVNV